MDANTSQIMDIFSQISAIPRCSKNEAQISQWLHRWADGKGFTVRTDSAGNMVIAVPATKGSENKPAVVIQGHMDMVCEKAKGAVHDFSKDPIRLVIDGEWLTADQTSLGADNGIALAYALAIAEDPKILHPPLELLFTVDEESGLLGAKAMSNEFVEGRLLLNIDSEEEGVFTVGCAGGQDTRLVLDLPFSAIAKKDSVLRLRVSGLRGGHSGVDIHKQRASANRLLARVLNQYMRIGRYRLLSINGGTTHNAIARDAEACLSITADQIPMFEAHVVEMETVMRAEYQATDPDITLNVTPHDASSSVRTALSETDTGKVVNLLMALPHGVAAMSNDIDGLVETSNNLAVVTTKNHSLQILSSQRSSVMSRLAEITAQIVAMAELSGATTVDENDYPAWSPNMASPLLDRCKSVYQQLFSDPPEVQTIHAGLECGLIGAKHSGMDMISFGPTIQNPHSPDEKLHIPSIARVWDFLVELLKSYAKN